MGFKTNLIEKIAINRLARKAVESLAPREGISRIDADTMRQLLGFSPYAYRRERDLDLYVYPAGSKLQHILVLDNGLALYRTTVEDVVIRKSPTIKEMLNIRNAIRILNDSDVLISKKADSVETIRRACIDRLDLSFSTADIESLARDGRVALGIEDAEGIRETLSLFAEMLDYRPAHGTGFAENAHIICDNTETGEDLALVTTMVIYLITCNTLLLIDDFSPIQPDDRPAHIENVISGETKPALKGAAVFDFLKKRVLHPMTDVADRLS